jgi:hypothetical protein
MRTICQGENPRFGDPRAMPARKNATAVSAKMARKSSPMRCEAKQLPNTAVIAISPAAISSRAETTGRERITFGFLAISIRSMDQSFRLVSLLLVREIDARRRSQPSRHSRPHRGCDESPRPVTPHPLRVILRKISFACRTIGTGENLLVLDLNGNRYPPHPHPPPQHSRFCTANLEKIPPNCVASMQSGIGSSWTASFLASYAMSCLWNDKAVRGCTYRT